MILSPRVEVGIWVISPRGTDIIVIKKFRIPKVRTNNIAVRMYEKAMRGPDVISKIIDTIKIRRFGIKLI